MNMARIAALILFFLINGLGTNALNRDSLLTLVKSSMQTDSEKVRTLTVLMADARPTEKLLADQWFKQGLQIARRNKNSRQQGEILKAYAEYYRYKLTNYAMAFKYANESIDAFEKGQHYPELMYAYHFLARDVFEQLGLVDEAIDAMKRCAYYAKKGRANELYFRLYELGWYETVNKMPREGFTHLHESYKIIKPGDPLIMELLIWMGNTFSRRNDFETALKYHLKAARYADSVGAIAPKYDTYRYAAYCHRQLGNKDTAIAYLKRAYDYYVSQKDFDRIHFLAADLLSWHTQDKNFKDADIYARLLTDSILFDYRTREDLRIIVDLNLHKYFYARGDYKKSVRYLNDYLEVEDSVKNRNERLNLGEQNLRLNFLKQREIQKLLQKQKDMEETARADTQRKKIWLLIAAVGLTVILLLFSIRNARQRQAAYKEISIQKNEVEKQKQLVEHKNKEIVDSMHYARRIQSALLAHKEQLDEFIPDNFIYFKPRDIVSGDFYWTTKISTPRDKFYLAVCDSTGHGVPGAFMSLLNIGFLAEAIKEKDLYDPHKAFNYIRSRLIKTMSTEGQKDGFDGILMCYDPAKSIMTYASANNHPLQVTNGELKKLEFDRQPVGQTVHLRDFKLYTLQVQKGDTFYFYTDGYEDQFGGPKGKKFLSAKLEKLILGNAHLPMQQQMEILDKAFVEWKGTYEQVDDVCVIGFRI